MTATEPKAAKLIVEGLCKRYGATTALQPSSLSVAEGEFLTLLGPSGSGKTTLLQLICGLVDASEGRVVIDGRDQSSTPVHQRDIGLVFQHYALFPHLTVAENIAFPLGTPREIYERPRTAFAADFIGISNIFRGRWDGNGSLDTAHGRFALPQGARCETKDAALVIRPENLRIGAQDGNMVSGRVSEIVDAGSETRVIAALQDGSQLVLRLGPDDAVPAIDEAIVAGWPRDKAVLVA